MASASYLSGKVEHVSVQLTEAEDELHHVAVRFVLNESVDGEKGQRSIYIRCDALHTHCECVARYVSAVSFAILLP